MGDSSYADSSSMPDFDAFPEPKLDNIGIDVDSISYTNPMYGLSGPKGAEYIFADDNQARKMSWADRSTWLWGGAWLTGGVIGTTWGGLKGLRDAERGLPWKLRLNACLNGAGRKGGRVANGLGALVLLYSGVETATSAARQKQDGLNIVAGTSLAPLIYWSGAGLVKCLSFSVLGAIAGAGLVVGHKYNVMGLRKILPADE
jgi:hypothetical protein